MAELTTNEDVVTEAARLHRILCCREIPQKEALSPPGIILRTVPGKAIFRLWQGPKGPKLLGVVRFAKDLPENFPGERLTLARCGAAVVAELTHETAGALKSLLQLASPLHVSAGGADDLLLCRPGFTPGETADAEAVRQAGLVPCWVGGAADEAFWSAFAFGWHDRYYRCRAVGKMRKNVDADEALTTAYGGRHFVLNDGSALVIPDRIDAALPEELPRCEAVEAETAAELLILSREVRKAGGAVGLAVIKTGDPAEEKLCRAVAAGGGIGHLAVAPERFAALRQTGTCNGGCDWRDDSFAEAAENIKKMTFK